jgi:hypothetical protein
MGLCVPAIKNFLHCETDPIERKGLGRFFTLVSGLARIIHDW